MKKRKKKELSRKSTDRNKQDKPAHPLRKEIVGLLFLLIAIILAGSLFSYHPNDRLVWNVTGAVGKAHNLFGTVGAHLAG
ncbi:MAG: DNA translocase FtsK 4TM domain-containing protein, partial [Desulfobacteraceae bacterium]|nr:DNA translocase FtsK 4TM domain-containing protein [Desulfobacteraceae bacterium]